MSEYFEALAEGPVFKASGIKQEDPQAHSVGKEGRADFQPREEVWKVASLRIIRSSITFRG